MKILSLAAAAAGALALCACSTIQITNATQEAERLMTEGNQLYVAVQAAAKTEGACQIVPQAWTDLQIMRAGYAAGQTISLAALLADEGQLPTAPKTVTLHRDAAGINAIDITNLVAALLPDALQLIESIEQTQAASNQAQLDSLYMASVTAADAVAPTAALPCGS